MAEYIERAKATEFINECLNHEEKLQSVERETLIAVKKYLESILSADVRPVVKAEWFGEGDGYADGELVYDMWSCPICGKRFFEWEEKPGWNFCPNCGADMREAKT